MQAPMISTPLKATNEVDWVYPLKQYIRDTYGDDPERYAEECTTLNRLRQDMRGAGRDSAAGRDLLYRYYGQLELLDLRFPVDENHIKIAFTWFDAFTHKPTAQFSLAYEKASIIFNISAVLSCHAAQQARSEESGLKTAYHSFQASAGMFTYINENFLHAPSTDLSRETVKTLIQIMLAQGQEVFLEKQIADGKKSGLLAKLASQANYLYGQAVEGAIDNVSRAVFEKVWLLLLQIKASYMAAVAQHYQGLAEDDANSHGPAIARLKVAEEHAKEATRLATTFPTTIPANANLNAETGAALVEMAKRQLATIQTKLVELIKDNDYIYHQTVPAEASLAPVPKLAAAKAIPVSELYAGQDIGRITGPDIFAKIVPIQVTESASLYDEEKAKLVRAETERVETANSEMAASLDYLRLPGALQALKGGQDQNLDVDDDFQNWCEDVATHERPVVVFQALETKRSSIIAALEKNSKELDMEESVCEKMRSKYEAEWTQQPSARLTATLRGNIRNYREALTEAAKSDGQIYQKIKVHDDDFDQMRSAGEVDESDVLWQRAIAQVASKIRNSDGHGGTQEGSLLDADVDTGPSITDQIRRIEDILKKLGLIKKERSNVLKDLKEKAQNDDISQVLILNKKNIANYESQLFRAELEKFRPHQNRLTAANQKQTSLMKELTGTYNVLLQDKRVRAEQGKIEHVARQRTAVLSKYRRIHQEFMDLQSSLESAKQWYLQMIENVESLEKNIEAFVNNRRSEGRQLLDHIEKERASKANGHADLEQQRVRELMERMSMNPGGTPDPNQARPNASLRPQSPTKYPPTTLTGQYRVQTSSPPSQPLHSPGLSNFYQRAQPSPRHEQFPHSQVASHPQQGVQTGHWSQPRSPPASQTSFQHGTDKKSFAVQPPSLHQQPQQQQQPYIPPGYIPPPPPPGPPPLGPQQTIQSPGSPPMAGHGEYGYGQRPQPTTSNDPWAGLNAWK